ncbi:hypothetical protein M431DRAFT_512513 [Trichoderma harzianum CBS 226.95]|uniref:Uncharacterized protein n=1 Tax=Trichoderma harzianum CBS 226.95 TaxID=983964 RepID=A0A2T3ZY12_TRIHA|nr:hypothetical protein M431DRAFT_512513 [Trichoderma harzianum CBS 226.95]PTB49704.1 hypothetical protein M431DRAFT_512513 [Trichoderma harzianum CBS 226.95]
MGGYEHNENGPHKKSREGSSLPAIVSAETPTPRGPIDQSARLLGTVEHETEQAQGQRRTNRGPVGMVE